MYIVYVYHLRPGRRRFSLSLFAPKLLRPSIIIQFKTMTSKRYHYIVYKYYIFYIVHTTRAKYSLRSNGTYKIKNYNMCNAYYYYILSNAIHAHFARDNDCYTRRVIAVVYLVPTYIYYYNRCLGVPRARSRLFSTASAFFARAVFPSNCYPETRDDLQNDAYTSATTIQSKKSIRSVILYRWGSHLYVTRRVYGRRVRGN